MKCALNVMHVCKFTRPITGLTKLPSARSEDFVWAYEEIDEYGWYRVQSKDCCAEFKSQLKSFFDRQKRL